MVVETAEELCQRLARRRDEAFAQWSDIPWYYVFRKAAARDAYFCAADAWVAAYLARYDHREKP